MAREQLRARAGVFDGLARLHELDLLDAVAFVREFVTNGKPVGVICHGPWTLLEAGVVEGRRITSWPSVRTDLRNAGAEVVDEGVVIDANLVSSRWPDDLPAFCEAIVREFSAVHAP